MLKNNLIFLILILFVNKLFAVNRSLYEDRYMFLRDFQETYLKCHCWTIDFNDDKIINLLDYAIFANIIEERNDYYCPVKIETDVDTQTARAGRILLRGSMETNRQVRSVVRYSRMTPSYVRENDSFLPFLFFDINEPLEMYFLILNK